MSITTQVGDRGSTFLFSGERVSKDSPRTHAYGDLDELVSVLGLARSQAKRTKAEILALQRLLFSAGSELATSVRRVSLLKSRIDAAALADFDNKREALEKSIRMPAGFIVPGTSVAGAHLDHARTIARRLERRVVGLRRMKLVRNPHLMIWLNRLSDYLWLLARREEGRSTPLK
jgi:cob(I)alamin adenosyltransferase